ncbi:hypothetical protein [Maridesulfovibrio hydrothermalis]|uniref:Uncharacterized protein n=1 Tax=Maridesulfovibrio hydrothermalis AM13 = DSM 14728 TaxID=1121451 RepID=L0R656_9BACT|nr:hypothetical protein [Maridesulfovibrio hydrothermalis]CCO22169.1 conserved protein of unknown function [Maridesulfovibrio hydrothermalis AM13 = DSM 14728]
MFIDEKMCGCGGDVKLNDRMTSRISLMDVYFTQEAMIRIGLGIKKLAITHGLPEGIIKQHMKGNLFNAPPSKHLYFLFHVPELEADMHITIPPCHWKYIGEKTEDNDK